MDDLLHADDGGAIRCADAVAARGWRTHGAAAAAGPAVRGDDAEQLGLATPEFQDVALGPATFRKAKQRRRSCWCRRVRCMRLWVRWGMTRRMCLFETAVGVLIDDVLYKITNSFCSQAMGMPYCYWLTLEPPVR